MPDPSSLPRRRFLGGVTTALVLPQLPTGAAAQASDGWIPSRAGLPWASGVRDKDPNSFVAYRENGPSKSW